jgi:hypothetical protein
MIHVYFRSYVPTAECILFSCSQEDFTGLALAEWYLNKWTEGWYLITLRSDLSVNRSVHGELRKERPGGTGQ